MKQARKIYVLTRHWEHDFWGDGHKVIAVSGNIRKLRKIMKDDVAATKEQEERSIRGFKITWAPKFSRNENDTISVGYSYPYCGCVELGNDRIWTWEIQAVPFA